MRILFILLFLTTQAVAQEGRRLEVLFLGDNKHHKPIERVPQLMTALGPKGINFTYTDKLEDLNATTLSKYDALMIYANWDVLSPDAEKALLDFVASGKGFLPIHCASYCFANSQAYTKLVGGRFWRHTLDSITAQIVDPKHPIMQGLAPFTSYDETYLHSDLQPDNYILAEREIMPDQSNDKPGVKTEPYTWTRTHGKGKIFYTAYGHDERTWQQKGFQDLIYNAILWSVNDDALAAFQARNPKPFEYKAAKLPNYEQRPGIQYQQLALSPEESMKHIQIPVDFNLELFAAEPNVMHPIAFSWDERGRMFVLITKDYPNERKASGGSDYILICEDTNNDGKADKFKTFADGLNIPTGMVFANGGLYVAQAPDMLFLKDTDGDDKADVKKVMFTGFGTFDTHAGPSNLHYGFDNWIWGCVGYAGFKGKLSGTDSLQFGQAFYRFKPDGSKLEWMTSTSNNTWGFAFNETNDVFGSTANNSHGWYMAIPHSYINAARNVTNGSRSTDTHRDMKPITEKVRQVDVFGGFTAAAGHNFYTARSFPKKYWNNIAFVAEPTGHILHQNQMVKKGTDFSDVEAFNLMASADEWFSPVFAEVGPDGAVWVADWYSYIIQHNPTPQGFDNGEGNAYVTDLRDYTHGRIYRVSYKEAPAYKPMALSINNVDGLLAALKSDNMFWRMNAQRMIVEREQKDIVPQLVSIARDQSVDEIGINAPAIHALWTLKGLNALDDITLTAALTHPSSDMRKNAIKTMEFSAVSVAKILKHNLLNDADPLVVMNALLLFSKSPLDATAEKAFFDRMNSSDETKDRWLPEAFATVLTANKGKLLRKHFDIQAKLAAEKKTAKAAMSHEHHHMQAKENKPASAKKSDGIDLVITGIKITPEIPSVGEWIRVSVDVTNQGSADLDKEKYVPLDIRFEGMGMKIDQVSRNYKDGIKSGETVSITKNINGPWVGDIAFTSDIVGDYALNVSLDKANEIMESDKLNNQFSKSIRFVAPADMNTYALSRAITSYASLSPADSLISLLKKSKAADAEFDNMVITSIEDGWNFQLKNVKITPANKAFLTSVSKNANESLSKLLVAWNAVAAEKPSADVKRIVIKTIREAMKFDIKEFTVKPGQTVEITIENPDAMQHNMVFTKPGMLSKVGKAGDAMMKDEKGAEKNYVPSIPEVLFSTPLISPGKSYKLTFKAPATAGDYPYVCTFPGHWTLMNGVMKVR